MSLTADVESNHVVLEVRNRHKTSNMQKTIKSELLQTGTPKNRKPLETEQFCQSRISVFLFKLPL